VKGIVLFLNVAAMAMNKWSTLWLEARF
jgi:hypothetical protein